MFNRLFGRKESTAPPTKETELNAKENKVWSDGLKDDIVLIIMGPTGVGKSTFVNHLLHDRADKTVETAVVGKSLTSCTQKVMAYPISLTGRSSRLIVVDTPGFDDTYQSDAEILRQISVWLASAYTEGLKLGGVIYLHDITQPRMTGTARKNLDLFQALCGPTAAAATIFVTTKWTEHLIDMVENENREQELSDNFWKDMIQCGAHTQRFDNTSQCAWKIADTLIGYTDVVDIVLQIQDELVTFRKDLGDTTAGQKLLYTLQELQNHLKTNPSAAESSKELIKKVANQINELGRTKNRGRLLNEILKYSKEM